VLANAEKRLVKARLGVRLVVHRLLHRLEPGVAAAGRPEGASDRARPLQRQVVHARRERQRVTLVGALEAVSDALGVLDARREFLRLLGDRLGVAPHLVEEDLADDERPERLREQAEVVTPREQAPPEAPTGRCDLSRAGRQRGDATLRGGGAPRGGGDRALLSGGERTPLADYCESLGAADSPRRPGSTREPSSARRRRRSRRSRRVRGVPLGERSDRRALRLDDLLADGDLAALKAEDRLALRVRLGGEGLRDLALRDGALAARVRLLLQAIRSRQISGLALVDSKPLLDERLLLGRTCVRRRRRGRTLVGTRAAFERADLLLERAALGRRPEEADAGRVGESRADLRSLEDEHDPARLDECGDPRTDRCR
jgi:hypothetical protein